MDGTPSAFEDLIAQVHRQAASDDPLAQLETAVAVSVVVSSQADHLLDRFVQQARRAGHSWTDIGQRLGVSKQAARQRFADRTETLPLRAQLRPGPRACLAQAEQEAHTDGSTEIGTHHLLAGLLTEGVTAAILERQGVTADAIRNASNHLFAMPSQPHRTPPDMSEEAVCALETATFHATACSTPSDEGVVGTEHLLGALITDPDSRARRVLTELGVDIAAIKRELGNPPLRRRRWWRHHRPETTTCSFCGQPPGIAGRLVAGPGIHICAHCVRLATDILERDATHALPLMGLYRSGR
jgi:hypothetical protein